MPASSGELTLHSVYVSWLIAQIDWEFAGFGRGPHGDMAQLIAHLELLYIAASQFESLENDVYGRSHHTAIATLLSSLIRAYRANSDVILSKATIGPMMRSALLATGAEIINCAFWKRWICRSDTCPCVISWSHEDKARSHHCQLVQRMLRHGISYLRLAGHDEGACMRNVSEVRAARQADPGRSNGDEKYGNERFWLLDLFEPLSCR
jgi:hypothetical protein